MPVKTFPPTGAAMRSEDVREFVRRQPFEPLRISLTDGRTFDVVHPDLAMVGRSALAIGLRREGDADTIYDRLVTVSLLHVMQIELIPTQAPPANGVC